MNDKHIDELAEHLHVVEGKIVVDSAFKWLFAKRLLTEAIKNLNPHEKWWIKIPRALNVPQKIRRSFVNRKYEKKILNVLCDYNAKEKTIKAGIADREYDDFTSALARRTFVVNYCQKLDKVLQDYAEEYNRGLIQIGHA